MRARRSACRASRPTCWSGWRRWCSICHGCSFTFQRACGGIRCRRGVCNRLRQRRGLLHGFGCRFGRLRLGLGWRLWRRRCGWCSRSRGRRLRRRRGNELRNDFCGNDLRLCRWFAHPMLQCPYGCRVQSQDGPNDDGSLLESTGGEMFGKRHRRSDNQFRGAGLASAGHPALGMGQS